MLGRNVAHGGDSRLHDEKIRAGLLRYRRKPLGFLGNGTYRREHAGLFKFLDAPGNEFLLDGFQGKVSG